jgi:hypothetical protein
MIKDIKVGTKVKAVKAIYYVSEDSFYEDWYTKEEIMNCLVQNIEVGDVYICEGEDWKCIEGSMEGEYSDGWFEMRSMIEKGVFVVVE